MRSFLGWTAPALPRAAALLADHYARGPELRIDPATVVLPGARAGRRLKELLLEEAERRELRLVPPRITTVGALPELLYEPPHPFADPALTRRLWVRALRLLPAERLVRLLSVPPADADLLGWTRTAAMIDGLHGEVGGGGLRFREVIGECAEGLLFCDEERWSILAELQDAFSEELRRLERADRQLARIDALRAGSLRLEGDIWLIGVAEMPRITHRMLEAAVTGEHRLRVMIHAPEEEAEAFDALGCVRPEAWLEREIPIRDAQIAVRGRPPDQASEVVRTLATLDGRHAADDIVVAVPDPALIPYLERHLEAAGVPVRAADGLPVERSAPYRLLSAIADYLQGGRFDSLAALARHPDLGRRLRRSPSSSVGAAGLREEDGWLEPLDRYFSRHLPEVLREVVQGSGEGSVVEALRTALQHPTLLGDLRGKRRSAAWAGALLELLAEVYGDTTLNRAVPEERLLLQLLETFRDAAAEMSRIPEAVDEACDAPTAIRLLLDGVEGVMIAPAAERAAVELLGWLELHLDDAPVVAVAGFNEPFLPASVNAHAYLPNALRARLGLVDNDARYARDAYQLTALLHSRAEVRVIAGRRTAEGDPLRPSRLMFAVQGVELAERVRRFYGADGKDGSTHAEGDTERGELTFPLGASTPARASGFHLPPEPELRADVPITTLPVTAFRGLIQDPYGYALERILRLEGVDDTAREMDGLAFGGLAHEVLEAFGHSPELHSTDAARIRSRLRGLLDERMAARFRGAALPPVRIQGEQLRARLDAFAEWQAAWISAGWRVLGVECRTPREGVPFVVDGEPIGITGRIDRIDHHAASDQYAVFDYKTGDAGDTPEKTHRAGAERGWIDLQLPLYRHLLPAVRDREGRPPVDPAHIGELRLGYLRISANLEDSCESLAEWSADELEEADERAREVIRFVRHGVFAFDPTRVSRHTRGPLAALLGRGRLEAVAEFDEEAEG